MPRGNSIAWRVADLTSVAACVERIRTAVASTWPSFDASGIRWLELAEEWGERCLGAADPVAEMQGWLARLGDAHTGLRPVPPLGRLSFRARVEAASVVLTEVPSESAAFAAGARAGHALAAREGEPFDVESLWARHGTSAHSKARVVGLRALQGPLGERVTLRTREGSEWMETFESVPWPHVVEWRRLSTGLGLVSIRAFLASAEPALDEVMEELRDCAGLVVDLRGNGGGNFAKACRFRSRFLEAAGPVGAAEQSLPGGGLGPREPIHDEPAEASRRVGGPTCFLVDSETYSASEDCLGALAGLPRVAIVSPSGEPTGGGSGRARQLRLLPGWRLLITTCRTFTRDGHLIEGHGVPVDRELPAWLRAAAPDAVAELIALAR